MRLADIKALPLHGRKAKRLGRGRASGHGKSSGRGVKGALSRSGAGGRHNYEGGQMPLFRRLPKRGFTNATFAVEYAIINVEDLSAFAAGAEVDIQALRGKQLVRKNDARVKIL